ncbi:MAG: 50S ribosomal protein L32, partial [Ruminococcus sp.]|nr:50S ribosomal protein L32 [Ruminococcus sp.]
APAMTTCDHCGAYKAPHKVCKSCGYYKGVAVLKMDAE